MKHAIPASTAMMLIQALLGHNRQAERLRLSRELHDGAVQQLTALGFGLAELAVSSSATNQEAIRQLQASVVGVARQLRELTSELRSAKLPEPDLTTALEGMAARFSRERPRQSPQIRLELEEIPELSGPHRQCLLHCAQEALHNCVQHAQAQNVVVRLQRRGAAAELSVEDDGLGFRVPARLEELSHSRHYGLVGMAERAAQVAGSLDIVSRAEGGTRVGLTLAS